MTRKEAIGILGKNVMVACDKAQLDDTTYNIVLEALEIGLKSIYTIDKLVQELEWQQSHNMIQVGDVLNIISEEMKEKELKNNDE